MIYPVILHHDSSQEYTNMLRANLAGVMYGEVNSSFMGTQFTRSFNIGLEYMHHYIQHLPEVEYVMVCNNDITLSKKDVAALNTILDGKVGIFSPVVNSPHNAVMSKQGDNTLRQVPWVEFVCPIIHRDVIESIGLLDTDMEKGWGVELDYCYRAKIAGFNTYLVQDIAIHHYGHKSQVDHAEYCDEANREMNHVLANKYGDNWHSILKYPQW